MLAAATPGEEADELLPPQAAATMATTASRAIDAKRQETGSERDVRTVKTPLSGLLPAVTLVRFERTSTDRRPEAPHATHDAAWKNQHDDDQGGPEEGERQVGADLLGEV
jgi:hypothetical protein